MITLDTSGAFALLNHDDSDYRAATKALRAEVRPYLMPAAILGELAYLVQTRLPPAILDRLLTDLEDGRYTLVCDHQDLTRVQELVRRYADLPLGLVDAAVIACAERNGGRVLTFDLCHFGVVAREGTITIVP